MRFFFVAAAFVFGACVLHSGAAPFAGGDGRDGTALFALALAPTGMQARQLLWEWAPMVMLAVGGLGAAVFHNRGNRNLRAAAMMVAMFAAGFWWADFRAEGRLEKQLPPELVWRDIVVEGEVLDLPRRDSRRTRFDLRIDSVVSPATESANKHASESESESENEHAPEPIPEGHASGEPVPEHVPEGRASGEPVPEPIPEMFPLVARISDYHHDGSPLHEIQNGARLRMKVRVRPPAVSANPHGFEYGDYLFARDIQLQGYVRDRASVVVVSPGGGLREYLRERAMNVLPPPQNGLLAAFVVGDRSGISTESYEVLRRTGVAHLVSVSGAHIALAAGFAAVLIAMLWRRFRALTRRMPAARAAMIAAIPASFAYALLAGFGVPVRRSFLMLALAAVAMLCGKTPAAFPALALAAAVIVFADPWAVAAPGFWLSFALVAAVVLALAGGGSGMGLFLKFARMQVLVSVFAVPLALFFFNEASLASPVANLIAVPVVGFAVLPMALADVLLPGDVLWKLAGWILEWLWRAMEWLASHPLASRSPAAAPWWLFAAAMVGAGWTLSPSGAPMRWAGLPPIVALLLWSPPAPEGMRVVFLNVGQGSAVVVRAAGKTLLYDAGPGFAGRFVVAPFLRGEGIRKLDAVVVSHGDADHYGGAADVLRAFPAGTVFASFAMDGERFGTAGTDGEVFINEFCEAGTGWRWGEVEFSFLHPDADDYGRGLSDNEMSCVLKAESPGGSVLLTGDIPAETELALAERLGGGGADGEVAGSLDADVLLASHHGSRLSSAAGFFRAVSPGAVVFSGGGSRSRFGHPHPEVVSRARSFGASVYRTDRDGAIAVDFAADGIRVEKWREKREYWWDKNPDAESE